MKPADTESDATRSSFDFLSTEDGRRILSLIRIRMGFPDEAFALAVRPLIEQRAGHCDCNTAPPGARAFVKHEALLSALILVVRALDLRRQRILPPNAAPEELGALAHRWTFAVVAAALLHDLGGQEAGLAARMLEESMPEPVKSWLAEDPFVHQLLLATVNGEHRRPNPLAEIIEAAIGGTNSGIEEAGPSVEATSSAEAQTESGDPASRGNRQVAWPAGLAGEFFSWLKDGLAAGAIEVNGPKSLVQRVPEGILLVSPGIFRAFLVANGAGSERADALKELQRAVFKVSGLLAADGGGDFHGYAWRGGEGARRPMHGIVVTDAIRLMDPDPPINDTLARIGNGPGSTA